MSATTQAAPSFVRRILRRSDLPAYVADGRSLQAEDARRARNAARGWRYAAFSLGAIAFGEAFGIVSMLPLVRVVPVMVTLRADGSWESSVAWSSVPPDQQKATVQYLLWQYVRLREGYSSGESNYAYNVVSAMSAGAVKQQFQEWYRPEDNRDAPMRRYGQRTVIRILRAADPLPLREDAWRFDFCRIEVTDGREVSRRLYTVTLRYQTVEAVPAYQRIDFNPAGVQVWEYPGPTLLSTRAERCIGE